MKDLATTKDEFTKLFDAEMFDAEGTLYLPELTRNQAEGLEPDPELVALMEKEHKTVA